MDVAAREWRLVDTVLTQTISLSHTCCCFCSSLLPRCLTTHHTTLHHTTPRYTTATPLHTTPLHTTPHHTTLHHSTPHHPYHRHTTATPPPHHRHTTPHYRHTTASVPPLLLPSPPRSVLVCWATSPLDATTWWRAPACSTAIPATERTSRVRPCLACGGYVWSGFSGGWNETERVREVKRYRERVERERDAK